jgi:high-affinity Fe2+/Pb2+ permease
MNEIFGTVSAFLLGFGVMSVILAGLSISGNSAESYRNAMLMFIASGVFAIAGSLA